MKNTGLNSKYQLCHFNKKFAVSKIIEQEDKYGGITKKKVELYNIWVKLEPILDNRVIFSEGESGLVNYEGSFYRVITNSSRTIKPGYFLSSRILDLELKIYKSIRIDDKVRIFITKEVSDE